MALTKRGKVFHFEFKFQGSRFRGSTKAKSKREAKEFERQKRKEVAEAHHRGEALALSPLSWGVAAARYWEETAQHHRSADRTLWALEWLTRYIGQTTPLSAINSDMIARLVAKRRAAGVGPATVNRSMTEPLRRVLNRARLVWGVSGLPPIEWRRHLQREPKERVRELRGDEEAVLFRELRSDYHPVVKFALLTGCRLSECVGLSWADVDFGNRLIWINGKGGVRASIPMPPTVRELLFPLQGHHANAVFTYRATVSGPDTRKGVRYPVTYAALQKQMSRTIKRAGIMDLRSYHDFRHTAATRVLRATGNLNIVKNMLRHSNIKTTIKYAHSLHDDVLAGMEAAAQFGQVSKPAPDANSRRGAPTLGPHSDRKSSG